MSIQMHHVLLVGSADHKVPFGASAIYIPGAVATDGDPKYSGKITTMTNATLDASVLGSAVLYTYTTTDSAGNTNSTILNRYKYLMIHRNQRYLA